MIYSSCRFTLDIQKLHSQVSVPVSLGDTAKSFYITLQDRGAPYFITTGCLAMLSIKRPSGTHLQAFCVIENNTRIKYDFSENEYTAIEEGVHNCELTLYGPDGGQLSTSWFTMLVYPRVVNSDDIVFTDEDITALDAILAVEAKRQAAEIKRAEAETKRAETETEILTAFNDMKGYFKGDKGDKGDKGEDGTMTFEDLTEEQIEALRGEKGDKGDKGDTGDKGEKGDEGEKGDKGDPGEFPYTYGTEDITVGTTTLATGALYFVYE